MSPCQSRGCHRATIGYRTLLLSELLDRIPDVVVVYDVSECGSDDGKSRKEGDACAGSPRYEFLNQAALQSMGQSDLDNVRGKYNFELLGADARDQIDEYVMEVKRKGKVVTCEHRIPTEKGVRVFHTQYSPLDRYSPFAGPDSHNGGCGGEEGRGGGFNCGKSVNGACVLNAVRARAVEDMRPEDVMHVIGVCRDVTEEKQMEDNVRIALETSRRLEQKAIEATQSKTRFLANVSHDLRTPLNGILGSCDLLEGNSQLQCAGEEVPELIQFIKTSSSLLLNLINDILDVSKLEEGKLDLQLGAFSLQRCVEAVITMVRLGARERCVSIHAHYSVEGHPGETDAVVLLDESRITQVLVNLLSNAVKFARPDTTINICIKLTHEPGDQHPSLLAADEKRMMNLDIRVEDEGIGISEEDLKRLFEPFFQAVSRESGNIMASSMGTGLGLAITRQLCEMMGGSVRGESELGKGSTFTVTIPCAVYMGNLAAKAQTSVPSISTSATASTPAAPGGKRKRNEQGAVPVPPPRAVSDTNGFDSPVPPGLQTSRILIAEDNDISRMLLVKLLRRMGFKNVTATANGRELLHKFGEVDPADPCARFDILLLDSRMPFVDGLECVKIIRDKYRKEVQPMIAVISADAMIGDKERIMSSGADEYLGKPVTHQAILAMLVRLTGATEGRATSTMNASRGAKRGQDFF